jgi:hypothetical protein
LDKPRLVLVDSEQRQRLHNQLLVAALSAVVSPRAEPSPARQLVAVDSDPALEHKVGILLIWKLQEV